MGQSQRFLIFVNALWSLADPLASILQLKTEFRETKISN